MAVSTFFVPTSKSGKKVTVPYTQADTSRASDDFYPVIFKPEDANANAGAPFVVRVIMLCTTADDARNRAQRIDGFTFVPWTGESYLSILVLYVDAALSGTLDDQLDADCVGRILGTFDGRFTRLKDTDPFDFPFIDYVKWNSCAVFAWVRDLAHPERSLNQLDPSMAALIPPNSALAIEKSNFLVNALIYQGTRGVSDFPGLLRLGPDIGAVIEPLVNTALLQRDWNPLLGIAQRGLDLFRGKSKVSTFLDKGFAQWDAGDVVFGTSYPDSLFFLLGEHTGMIQLAGSWATKPGYLDTDPADSYQLRGRNIAGLFPDDAGEVPAQITVAPATPDGGPAAFSGRLFGTPSRADRLSVMGHLFMLCPVDADTTLVPGGQGPIVPRAFFLDATQNLAPHGQLPVPWPDDALETVLPVAGLVDPDGQRGPVAIVPFLGPFVRDENADFRASTSFVLSHRIVDGNPESYLAPVGTYKARQAFAWMPGLNGGEFIYLNAGDILTFLPHGGVLAKFGGAPAGTAQTTTWAEVTSRSDSSGTPTSYWSQSPDFTGYQSGAGKAIPAVAMRLLDIPKDQSFRIPFLPFRHSLSLSKATGAQVEAFEADYLRFNRWSQGDWTVLAQSGSRGPIACDPQTLAPLGGTITTPQGMVVELGDGSTTGPKGSWTRLALAQSNTDPTKQLALTTQYDPVHGMLSGPLQLFTALCFGAPNIVVTGDGNDPVSKAFTQNIIPLGEFTFTLDLSAGTTTNPPIMVLKLARGMKLRDVLTNPRSWVGNTAAGNVFLNRPGTDAQAVLTAIVNDVATPGGARFNDENFADLRMRLDAEDWTGVLFFNCPLAVKDMPPDIQMVLSGVDQSLTAHHVVIDQSALDTNGKFVSSSVSAVISYDSPRDNKKRHTLDPKFKSASTPQFQTLSLDVLIRNSQVARFNSEIAFSVPTLFGERVDLTTTSADDRTDSPYRNVIEVAGTYLKDPNGKSGHIVFETTARRTFAPSGNDWRAVQSFIAGDIRLQPVRSDRDRTNADITRIVSHFALAGNVAFNLLRSNDDLFSYGAANPLYVTGYTFEIHSSLTSKGDSYTPSVDAIQEDLGPLHLSQIGPAGTVQPAAASLSGSMPWRVHGIRTSRNGITASNCDARTVTGAGLDNSADGAGGLHYAVELIATFGGMGALQATGSVLNVTLLLGWRTTGSPQANNIPGMLFLPPPGMSSTGSFSIQGSIKGTYRDVHLGRYTPDGMTTPDFYLEITGVSLSTFGRSILEAGDDKYVRSLFFSGGSGPNLVARVAQYKTAQPPRRLRGVGAEPPQTPQPGKGNQFSVSVNPCIYYGDGAGLQIPTDFTSPGSLDTLLDEIAASVPSDVNMPFSTNLGYWPPDVTERSSGHGDGTLVAIRLFAIAFEVDAIYYDATPTYAGQIVVPAYASQPTNEGLFSSLTKMEKFSSPLAGLRIFIVYRKINDHCGLLAINFTPPVKWQQIEIGDLKIGVPGIAIQIWTDGGVEVCIGWPITDITVPKLKIVIPIKPPVVAIGALALLFEVRSKYDIDPSLTKYFSSILHFGVGISLGLAVQKKGSFFNLDAGYAYIIAGEGWFASVLYNAASDYVWLNASAGIQLWARASISLGIGSLTAWITGTILASLTIESYHAVTLALTLYVTADFRVTLAFFTMHFHFSMSVTLGTISIGSGPNALASGPTPGAAKEFADKFPELAPKKNLRARRRFSAGGATSPLSQLRTAFAAPTGGNDIVLPLFLTAQPAALFESGHWKQEAVALPMMLSGRMNGTFSAKDGSHDTPYAILIKAIVGFAVADPALSAGDLPATGNDHLPAELELSAPEAPVGQEAAWAPRLAAFAANQALLRQLALISCNLGRDSDAPARLIASVMNALCFQFLPHPQPDPIAVMVMLPMFPEATLVVPSGTQTFSNANDTRIFQQYFQMLAHFALETIYGLVSAAAGSDLLTAVKLSALDGNAFVQRCGGFMNRIYLHGHRNANDTRGFYQDTGQQFAFGPGTAITLGLTGNPRYVSIAANGNSLPLDPLFQGHSPAGASPLYGGAPPLGAGAVAAQGISWKDNTVYAMPGQTQTPHVYHLKQGQSYKLNFAWPAAHVSLRSLALPSALLTDARPGTNRIIQTAAYTAGTTGNGDTLAAIGPAHAFPTFKIKLPLHDETQPGSNFQVYSLEALPEVQRDILGALLDNPGVILKPFFSIQTADPGPLGPLTYSVTLTRTNVATSIIPKEDRPAGQFVPADAATEIETSPFVATFRNDGSDAGTSLTDFLRLIWEAAVINARGYHIFIHPITAGAQPHYTTPPFLYLNLVLNPSAAGFTWAMPNNVLIDDSAIPSGAFPAALAVSAQGAAGSDIRALATRAWHEDLPAGTIGYSFSLPGDVFEPRIQDVPSFLEGMYHLVQSRLVSVAGLSLTAGQSAWSDPSTPAATTIAGHSRPTFSGKIDLFATLGGAVDSPYALIGKAVAVEFRLVDVYGNAYPTTSTIQWPSLPYTDNILGPHDWHFTQFDYVVAPGGTNGAALNLYLRFHLHTTLASLKPDDFKNSSDVRQLIAAYQRAVWQFGDANLSIALSSTLLASGKPYTGALKAGLSAYLAGVLAFLRNGDPQANAPVATLAIDLDYNDLSSEKDLFELTTTLTVARPASMAEEANPAISSVTFDVPPQGGDPDASGDAAQQSAIRHFADNLEKAYSSYDGNGSTLKLAQGPKPGDRTSKAHTYWLLRWSGPNGLQVSLANTNPRSASPAASPHYLAPVPLSTQLLSQDIVPPASLGAFASQMPPSVSNVDLDAWAGRFLRDFHNVLRPDRASLIGSLSPNDYKKIILAKFALGRTIAGELATIFSGDSAPTDTQTDFFEENLFTSVTNDYDTITLASFDSTVKVNHGIDNGNWSVNPFFQGRIARSTSNADQNYTFSSALIQIPKKGGTDDMPFLVSARHPKEKAFLDLAIHCDVTAFDYQFQSGNDHYGFLPSTWLSFVLPSAGDRPDDLSVAIGEVQIPLPLRSMPPSPRLARHSGAAANASATTIGDALSWNYTVSLAKPEAAQDDLVVTVVFNQEINTPANAQPTPPSALVNALCAWQTLYPAIQEKFTSSTVSLQDVSALAIMVTEVANSWKPVAGTGNRLDTLGDFDFRLRISFPTDGSLLAELIGAGNRSKAADLAIFGIASTNAGGRTTWTVPASKVLTDANGNFPLVLDNLFLPTHQCVDVRAYAERNRELVPEIETNPAFIYQSPTVQFPSRVVPYLECHDTIAIPGATLTEALTTILAGLQPSLDGRTRLSLQVGVRYAIDEQAGEKVHATRQDCFIQQDLPPGAGPSFIAALVQQLSPLANKACDSLNLILTLYATTDDSWMPLAKLTNLEIAPGATASWWT